MSCYRENIAARQELGLPQPEGNGHGVGSGGEGWSGGKGKMESVEKPAVPECRANVSALLRSSVSLWTAFSKN